MNILAQCLDELWAPYVARKEIYGLGVLVIPNDLNGGFHVHRRNSQFKLDDVRNPVFVRSDEVIRLTSFNHPLCCLGVYYLVEEITPVANKENPSTDGEYSPPMLNDNDQIQRRVLKSALRLNGDTASSQYRPSTGTGGSQYEQVEKMTYEDAITYLENHAEMDLFMENFVTLADVEHIERLINIQINKIHIHGLKDTFVPIETMMELCMERSLVIDEKEYIFWFDQTIYQDHDGSEALHIDIKLYLLRRTRFRVDGFLYIRVFFYFKAAKNGNLTMEVKLGWPWTDQMASDDYDEMDFAFAQESGFSD